MATRYAHPQTVVSRMTPDGTTYAAWTNVTDNEKFDTGGNSGVVLMALVAGTIVGDPKLEVRVDHSVDGLNWEELYMFPAWVDEIGNRSLAIPSHEGPMICAQYIRVMIKMSVSGTQLQYFEVKATLKG